MTETASYPETIDQTPETGHLLLQALRGETVSRPPVWLMRQAGRYLPEYQVLRGKYDFFTRVQTPELAAEITVQPIDIIGMDAAILFSDILVVPQAMGMEVQMHEGKGPLLPEPIHDLKSIEQLEYITAAGNLGYVYDAIRATNERLAGRVPLIGFAGAPWTIFCYMVEGKGSKTFEKAKTFCYQQPAAAHLLLDRITDVTVQYLEAQINAGVDCVQIFDSWAGVWDKNDFARFALPYLDRIVKRIHAKAPTILFAKGAWHSLPELKKTGAAALGIDWGNTPATARQLTENAVTLQGNYDPARLMQSPELIRRDVHEMINAFGPQRYIVNLGHGITPGVPVDHVKAFVQAVKEWKQ